MRKVWVRPQQKVDTNDRLGDDRQSAMSGALVTKPDLVIISPTFYM